MAFRLSKDQAGQRDALANELGALRTKLEEAIVSYNAEVEKLKAPVNAAVDAFNAKADEARNFAAEIASTAADEINNKSDKWQEGDKGQAAQAWTDEWENVELDDFEIAFPDELEGTLPEHMEILNELPAQADE